MTQKIIELIAQKKALIEKNLARFLPENAAPVLREAMEYALLSPGKRLRPLIAHLTFHGFLKDADEVCAPFAAAVEMIHAYSLTHDDLPAMDNDLYRRGLLTCHAKYGEAMAILTGDALLNRAYEIMCEAAAAAKNKNASLAMLEIAGAAGAARLITGQAMDISFFCEPRGIDYLLDIHRNKTSALFEAAFLSAGLLASCSQNDAEALKNAGELFGAAFQIKDDIADFNKSAENGAGEPKKKPEPNIAALMGMNFAKSALNSNFEKALACLEQTDADMSAVRALLKSVME